MHNEYILLNLTSKVSLNKKEGEPMEKTNKFEKKIYQNLVDPIIEIAAEERPNRDLESNAHYKARLTKQVHRSFDEFRKRFESGLKLLLQDKNWSDDNRLKKLVEILQDRARWEVEISQGKTIQEIFQFSDEELAIFYTNGWKIFHEGSYEDASHIFLFLTQLNPKVGAFWSALGGAEEKRGELKDAMQAYIFASELETQTLSPYLHGARCLLSLGKAEEAKAVLCRAIERIEQEPHLNEYKEVAEKMLAQIK